MRGKKVCRHLTSSFHDTHCKAGVCYRDVTPDPDEPGSAWREPCREVVSAHGLKVLAERGPQGTCEKREWLSEEEEVEREKVFQEAIRRMEKCAPLIGGIKREHRGESWKGVEVCPVCGGSLHLSHSGYNGHVWGRCDTEGCVSWVE